MTHTYNPRTLELEAEPEIQGHPWPRDEFKASLGCTKHCHKQTQTQTHTTQEKRGAKSVSPISAIEFLRVGVDGVRYAKASVVLQVQKAQCG